MAEDLFIKTVEGKYPISRNSGAARNWLGPDSVPRPDRQLWLLKLLSFVPLGLDHFYLRSPLTALPKMATSVGAIACAASPIPFVPQVLCVATLGIWWLWDIFQVMTESDRVLLYGMATPFDFFTGIGQGMITDKPTSYTTEVNYSLWLFGIALGFCGLDSLIAMNGGQALRKVLEFALFILCVVTVANYNETGISVGWISALVFGIYLSTIIIAEYVTVLTKVFGGDVFHDGIKFSEKEDEQYNSFFSWLINSTSLSEERKAEIIKDLEYGGISAADLKEMFNIKHMSEIEADDAKPPAERKSGTWISFMILMAAPFLIIFNFIVMGCKAMYYAIFPMAAVTSAMAESQLDEIKRAAARPVMSGGARKEILSLEAQVMGATVMALLAGGSLKGIVDYLMTE